jgi:hypothetical protein
VISTLSALKKHALQCIQSIERKFERTYEVRENLKMNIL